MSHRRSRTQNLRRKDRKKEKKDRKRKLIGRNQVRKQERMNQSGDDFDV